MSSYTLRTLPKTDDTVLAAYDPLVRRLLLLRGIATEHDAEQFLNPDWERDTHDPFLMKDMERVVERITTALAQGETIAIWSDYDMDGIPGAVVLWDLFHALGYEKVVHHTPHRNKDGFGLNTVGLNELNKKGVSLIITVDCGIGDVAQVAHANKKHMDVIITDHHLPHETLPEAYAILNPKQELCTYPEQMLCGAGVAFKLAHALLMYLARTASNGRTLPVAGWEKWLLDMAGMATIADMVPLVGENRVIAFYGLKVLRKSRRLGLQALLRKARAKQQTLTEDDVGFTIAPRVNAASRMGHASDAFALLSTTDPAEAGVLADTLDHVNKERKTVVATMKREINRRFAKLGEPKEVIVLGNPDWKPSLLGLVAGGLAEEYGRPAFLWGREEGTVIKGSCRSDGQVSVHEIMSVAHEHFIEFGGHAYSGGFSVEQERVHTLEAALIAAYRKVAQEKKAQERVADADLTLDEVSWATYRTVTRLAPFGEGNPKPLFRIRNAPLVAVRTFGKGNEHLELSFSRTDGSTVKAIAFFTTPASFDTAFHEGEHYILVVHIEASYFRYTPELRLRLVDIVAG